MSVKRLGGKDVRLFFGSVELTCEKFDLKIDDKRAPAMSRGIANGYVDGECTASGSVTLDADNFAMLSASLEGDAWKDIEPQDIQAFASAGGLEKDINAYGCLLRIEDLLSFDAKGGEKLGSTIAFDITDPDFVDIDGRPYLSADETDGFL